MRNSNLREEAVAEDAKPRSPFQSVKDAITLFVEVGSPKATTPVARRDSDEGLLQLAAQHHLMLKARSKYSDRLRTAEAAKAQALSELQMANKTLQLLTNKLQTLTDSKQAAIREAHAAKLRATELDLEQARRGRVGNESWRVELDKEREQYKATTGKLIASQEELTNLRKDCDATLLAKLAMFQKSERAQGEYQKKQTTHNMLLKLQLEIEQVRTASRKAEDEYMKLMAEKEEVLQSHKTAKQQFEKEIKRLQEEYEPAETLQEKLDETMEEIRVLQEQLNEIQSTDLYVIRKMAKELDSTKTALEEAMEEEDSLQSFINLTKLQLDCVKREHPETEKKVLEAESTAEQIEADLEQSKDELEVAMSGCVFIMQSCVDKLLVEAEMARIEAQKTKKSAELLRQETEAERTVTQEAEEKLKIALKEAEELKAAEKLAEERIYNCKGNAAAESHSPKPNRKIRMSAEEFQSINKKIEECKNKADIEVATAIAEVEAINARKIGIAEKLEAVLEENETIESEIREALKKAEMAETDRRLVETELQKRRQNGKAKK